MGNRIKFYINPTTFLSYVYLVCKLGLYVFLISVIGHGSLATFLIVKLLYIVVFAIVVYRPILKLYLWKNKYYLIVI